MATGVTVHLEEDTWATIQELTRQTNESPEAVLAKAVAIYRHLLVHPEDAGYIEAYLAQPDRDEEAKAIDQVSAELMAKEPW